MSSESAQFPSFAEPEIQAAWQAVSAAFESFGRTFICADAGFQVLHASAALDRWLGPGTSAALASRPLQELFGEDLFGATGTLRAALSAGERSEGWRAHLRVATRDPQLVSLSAAPFIRPAGGACDPRVSYVVILRPAGSDHDGAADGPIAFSGLMARSRQMARIFGLIENLKHSEASVLITGESGTGKEMVARAIHEHSARRGGPFVAVNCAALPFELLESEMFGHVRGAFTGAIRDRQGRFELASDGTLFLDEVGDLPLPLQVKLLRVLQDGTFERLGENQTRVSRARVIAATHVDLGRAIPEGRFREDLYYRLRVVPIEVPPLRDRPEDVEPLARAILARVGGRHGRALRFSPDALRVLLRHHWPGNVRELENAIEYAVAVCRGQTLLPEDLPELTSSERPASSGERGAPRSGATARPLGTANTDVATLRALLDAHHWSRQEVARALGVSRTTLWRRMRQAGLE